MGAIVISLFAVVLMLGAIFLRLGNLVAAVNRHADLLDLYVVEERHRRA